MTAYEENPLTNWTGSEWLTRDERWYINGIGYREHKFHRMGRVLKSERPKARRGPLVARRVRELEVYLASLPDRTRWGTVDKYDILQYAEDALLEARKKLAEVSG